MASRKDRAPTVSTFADHELITPPHEFRKAVANAADPDDNPVEAALAQLSSEFADWMHAECERLEAARRRVATLGFKAETQGELFRAAHDIKGEAATFGYPAVGAVAKSLCRLIEHTPDGTTYRWRSSSSMSMPCGPSHVSMHGPTSPPSPAL